MKCLWMTSGIISYKLCSRNYHCDDCVFDRVMHNENVDFSGHCGTVLPSASRVTVTACNSISHVDGSLFYHKNHCWVKVTHSDEVIIGINGILARLMYGIKTVILPKVGEAVVRDQLFAHILQNNHIVPLIMPVNGEILAVNDALVNNPDRLQSDFSDKGWLVKVKPDNLEQDLRTLSFGSKALEWYKAKDRAVSEAIRSLYSSNGQTVGTTMQDGGELMHNVSEILSSDQYNSILDEILQAD